MSGKGFDERRSHRQIKSARLKSIKARSRSPSPEKSKESNGSKRTENKKEAQKVKINVPKANVLGLSSKTDKARRMTQTYIGTGVPGVLGNKNNFKPQKPLYEAVTPSSKNIHLRNVMDKERKRAVAYRKAMGRRNAFDAGKPSHRNKNWEYGPRSKSVIEDREKKASGNGMTIEERCKSSIATSSEANVPNWEELTKSTGLTPSQVRAFYEVFDLFDSNGGGSIDADELDEAMRSVNINLTRDEIYSVLAKIDHDGNGEIDFIEFLQLMTNTERFIEALTQDKDVGRELLLFDALTEFMKKSALHSMDEIVGYYSHKYKRTQIPHVVNHYAAGARLIGLTERQLRQHLEHLKASHVATGSKGVKSPYAEPLHILGSSTNLQALTKLGKQRKRGRIKLFVHIESGEEDEEGCDMTRREADHLNEPARGAAESPAAQSDTYHVQSQLKLAQREHGRLDHIPVCHRGYGWVNERTEHIEVHLPSLHLRKLMPFSDLTAEDLPAIRTNVSAATRSYTKERRAMVLQENFKHWKALEANLISPKILQSHFRVVFSAYSLVGQGHLKIPAI